MVQAFSHRTTLLPRSHFHRPDSSQQRTHNWDASLFESILPLSVSALIPAVDLVSLASDAVGANNSFHLRYGIGVEPRQEKWVR